LNENDGFYDVKDGIIKNFLELSYVLSFEKQKDLKELNDVYIFSKERGLLLLSNSSITKYNISKLVISIPVNDSCFGNSYYQSLLTFIGHDTLFINEFFLFFNFSGYLHIVGTDDTYNLAYAKLEEYNIYDLFAIKILIFIEAAINLFCCIGLLSFVNRETLTSIVPSSVLFSWSRANTVLYLKVMFRSMLVLIGALVYLWVIINDLLLTFLISNLLWFTEVICVISIRTTEALKFFPKITFFYFLIYFLYLKTFPYGYYYLGFFTLASFIQYTILFVFHRIEIPAIERGIISSNFPREYSTNALLSLVLTNPASRQQPQEQQNIINIEMD